jgi:hypothetical protein
MDLVCGPQAARTAVELAGRWGRDRALSEAVLAGLTALVLAAVAHGTRFRPRAVSIALQWLDLDRVRIVVTWKGCAEAALPSSVDGELDSTVATLDTYAEDWGFGALRSGPILWMVIDTR